MERVLTYEDVEQHSRQMTKKVLDELGVARAYKGYIYIVWVIKEFIYAEFKDENICLTEIYRRVSQKHNATVSKIERDIRYVQESYQKELKEYFNLNITDTRVCNKQMIFQILHKVKEKINQNFAIVL